MVAGDERNSIAALLGHVNEASLFSSWPGKSAKRVFALDAPAIYVFLARAK